MKTVVEAKSALARVTFSEDQRSRSQFAWKEAEKLLETLWITCNDKPSAELTQACRKVEEALMWHSKAISNESK